MQKPDTKQVIKLEGEAKAAAETMLDKWDEISKRYEELRERFNRELALINSEMQAVSMEGWVAFCKPLGLDGAALQNHPSWTLFHGFRKFTGDLFLIEEERPMNPLAALLGGMGIDTDKLPGDEKPAVEASPLAKKLN